MGNPFVGEIRMFGGSFFPAGWAMCDGALMDISQNDVLFQLIGTTYGGDGQSTFAMPNLCGRVPIHMGTGSTGITYQIGEAAGVESVTLTTQQIPVHSHAMQASTGLAETPNPEGHVLAQSDARMYVQDVPDTLMHANALAMSGGNQPHENMAPFLAITFIISLYGIYPSP